MQRRALALTAPLLMFLGACATRPVAPPTVPVPPASVPPAPAPRGTLVTEQLRLSDLFRGTPVVFSLQQDGSLRATVPRRFSFEAGSAQVKPPLAAVLDRLAKSQLLATSRFRISAPADPDTRNAALARERAAGARDHLVAQGIAAIRIQAGAAVQNELVEVIVTDASR